MAYMGMEYCQQEDMQMLQLEPGYNTGTTIVDGARGCGLRGGGWANSSYKRLSDRQFAALVSDSAQTHYGFRSARTAP